MESSNLVLFGALAVGGYFVYQQFFSAPASWTSQGGTQAQWNALTSAQQQAFTAQYGTAGATGAPSSATAQQIQEAALYEQAKAAATAQAAPAASMDALAVAIQKAASADPNLVSGKMSGDHWNYYANNIMGQTFSAAYGPGQLAFTDYWSAQAPVIKAATGLAGIGPGGLGAFAGLGDLIERHRRGYGYWTTGT